MVRVGRVRLALYHPVWMSRQRRTAIESEAERASVSELAIRLVVGFDGALCLYFATLDLRLASATQLLDRLIVVAAILAGWTLVSLASGLLGQIAARRGLAFTALLIVTVAGCYGAWRLWRGAYRGDIFALVVDGLLLVVSIVAILGIQGITSQRKVP
jgi:hypothetical protein